MQHNTQTLFGLVDLRLKLSAQHRTTAVRCPAQIWAKSLRTLTH